MCVCVCVCGISVMVIIVGNVDGNRSSNPKRGYLPFISRLSHWGGHKSICFVRYE